MNYSRNDLTEGIATMNQIRNAIYHLVRFMEKNGVTDSIERMRRMGKNIARSYINYWKPTDNVSMNNIKDVLTTIYHRILNSTISIEINEVDNLIIIRDNNCALCKYHYEDIEISGCEIIMGLISEYINLISKNSKKEFPLFLEPYKIIESRAFGNNACVQLYKYNMKKGA